MGCGKSCSPAINTEETGRILGPAAATRLRDATDFAHIKARAASEPIKGKLALIELVAALAVREVSYAGK